MQYWLMEDSGIRLLREYIGSVVTDIMGGMLMGILGPNEEDVSSPRTYISNDDVFSRMYPAGYDKHGNIIYKTDEIDFLRH